MYNQLLYFRKLWDVDVERILKVAREERGGEGAGKVEGGKREGGEIGEKARAVVEWNRERWGTCRGVVEGYLGRCGRVTVQMGGLFGFMR